MWRLNYEEGGVTVFVALLLVVLFGMGALVLDVGNMFWERRQLQNGADAAALALAAKCADETIADCASATISFLGNEAEPYADGNAGDGESGVPTPMSHGVDPDSCEPGSDTADNPLTDGETVKVSTETIDANTGDSFLTHWLAPVLGIDTTTVSACAVATSGTLGGPVNVVPIAICETHYNDLTNNGGDFGPPAEEIFFGKEECEFQTDTYSGDWGWIDEETEVDISAGQCSVVLTEDQWFDAKTGSDTNNAEYGDCIEALHTYLEDNGGEVLIHVPIFSDYCAPSNSDPPCTGEHRFYVEGFAGFEISGYRFNGGPPSYHRYPDNSVCQGGGGGGPPSCIVGYFTEFVTYDGFINDGASDFGGTAVQLTN